MILVVVIGTVTAVILCNVGCTSREVLIALRAHTATGACLVHTSASACREKSASTSIITPHRDGLKLLFNSVTISLPSTAKSNIPTRMSFYAVYAVKLSLIHI